MIEADRSISRCEYSGGQCRAYLEYTFMLQCIKIYAPEGLSKRVQKTILKGNLPYQAYKAHHTQVISLNNELKFYKYEFY